VAFLFAWARGWLGVLPKLTNQLNLGNTSGVLGREGKVAARATKVDNVQKWIPRTCVLPGSLQGYLAHKKTHPPTSNPKP
jgi:hypothetical protein